MAIVNMHLKYASNGGNMYPKKNVKGGRHALKFFAHMRLISKECHEFRDKLQIPAPKFTSVYSSIEHTKARYAFSLPSIPCFPHSFWLAVQSIAPRLPQPFAAT